MTMLCRETLVNVLDLIAEGATVVETTAAIGGAPKSKIIFAWLNDSEAASEFGSPPDPESKWCIEWGERPLDWFHILYRQAVADGRKARASRKVPIRADLEARLAVKRATVSNAPVYSDIPIRADLEERLAAKRASAAPSPPPNPNMVRVSPQSHPTAPAPTVPSYAFKRAPRLDGEDRPQGPPQTGRFLMTADRPKSLQERQAGLPEITEQGIRYN
jgi:hypothetical protein